MRLLREYVRALLEQEEEQEGSELEAPKGEWVLLQPGDPRRERVKSDLYDAVQATYAPIGGHLQVQSPGDLDRYTFWVVADVDSDPDADVAIMGKPAAVGNKMGLAANDGGPAAAAAYKDMSARLRSGGSVGGVSGWWGELSGKPAYAMLSRGAPAVEDEAEVRSLLAGEDIEWHGEHPDPEAPQVFKAARGWYTRRIGSKSATKIIVGSPK